MLVSISLKLIFLFFIIIDLTDNKNKDFENLNPNL